MLGWIIGLATKREN